MKLSLFLLLLITTKMLFGQQVNGIVVDEFTKMPIVNASISASGTTVLTSSTGSFRLNNIRFGDSVTVSHIGYQSYTFKHLVSRVDTLKILLKKRLVAVQEVTILRKRNYSQDSLNRRKQYESVFNYKAPTIKDMFVNKSSLASNHYSPIQNSTASLVSINVLSAISLIGKNKSTLSKLQKRLLKDEEDGFLNQKFSVEKVQSITALKGDSLTNFMIQYRPTAEKAKKMTEYQLMVYIKDSYNLFTKSRRK